MSEDMTNEQARRIFDRWKEALCTKADSLLSDMEGGREIAVLSLMMIAAADIAEKNGVQLKLSLNGIDVGFCKNSGPKSQSDTLQ